jgi:hypothetical protein
LSNARVERTPCLVRVRHATHAKERLHDVDAREPWGVQRSPRKGRDERAGRVGKYLRGGAVSREGVVVAVFERGFAWLTGARGTRAEEVEGGEDYAWRSEGQGEHGYACEECGSSAGGREGALAEAIDGEGGGEEEGDERKVVVEHGLKGWEDEMSSAGGFLGTVDWLFVSFISACF